ncbi:MAG TPA: hypothetical protein VIH30_03815 [Aquirhabdus sp.]
MDNQDLINLVMGCVLTVLGWFARELWSAVKELKIDLANLRVEIPTKYLHKDEYREDMREIKNMLGRIFDKIDGKVDKS